MLLPKYSGISIGNLEKSCYLYSPKLEIMSKLVLKTPEHYKVLELALRADPAAFYVGEEKNAITGARLTASAENGLVTITSNRLTEEQLRELFAAFSINEA